VFNGCKALEVLNVRNAWNVSFYENVLANIGSAIDIYLFDEPDQGALNTSFGHPLKNVEFLGKNVTVTLKKIYFFAPVNDGKIQESYTTDSGDSSIAKYIRSNYANIDVYINKR